MSATIFSEFRDRRILIVEDEYMIADEVAGMLSEAGAETLGPVGNVPEALRIAETESRIDAALLDVNVQGQSIWPVVDALRARGVPLVLTTGYDAGAIPAAYVHLPRCEKPISDRDLGRALARAMSA